MAINSAAIFPEKAVLSIEAKICLFYYTEENSNLFKNLLYMTEQVDILLATYQGAPFIAQQIHSLLQQTYPYFHIWIRDDGSSDTTRLIIQKLAEEHSNRITVIPSYHNLGPKGNFSELMKHSRADYIFFCDQDDYWFPHKIEVSLNHLKQIEIKKGKCLPLLVYTDLTVARHDLHPIADSFWRYTKLNPNAYTLNRLLTQNIVTGCTMLANRALIDLAYPIPNETVMHDWWLALIASACGQIRYINKPTLLYRQHETNDIGATPHTLLEFLLRCKRRQIKYDQCQRQTYRQAAVFLKRYHHLLNPSQRKTIQAYVDLEHLSFWSRKKNLFKYQFFKHGFLRNLKAFLT